MHLLELFPGPLFLSPLHLIQADEPSISESEGTPPPVHGDCEQKRHGAISANDLAREV